MSFRNRCVIAGANGPVHLSVPIEKGRDKKQFMKDVRISYTENWAVRHWRTIESAYNRSPFFEYYRDDVHRLLSEKTTFLADLDMKILVWLKQVLAIPATIKSTSSYIKQYPENVLDYRDRLQPKNFDQPVPELRYTQVFEERLGFVPNLSILDLLFCCGPEATRLLTGNGLSI